MLARRIAFNTVISAAARASGTALALVTVGLMTRYLSRTQWGEYSIVLTFGGIFAVLAEGGLYQLMVREISRQAADEEKIASYVFTLRLVLGFFIFSLAPLVSLLLPYSSHARWGIFIGMLGFWFISGAQVIVGIFQKHLRMDKVAWAELAGRLFQLILVFLFIRWRLDFLWIIASLAFSGAVNFCLIWWLARSFIALRLRYSLDFWKKILKQSYPLAISGILTMVYFSSDSLLISLFKPAADVGIYRLPYKILESLIFFPTMFVGLVMPFLSRAAFVDWPQFKIILRRSQEVLWIFAAPLVLGTLIASPRIVELLGGHSYPESVSVLNILIIGVGIIFFGTLFSYALVALERQKVLLWISAVGAVFNLVLNLIFIPRYSYLAAATTTVLTEILVTILLAAAVSRITRLSFSLKTALKSLTAAAIMAFVLYQLPQLNLLVLVFLAAVIYFGLLWLLRGFSIKEILWLSQQEET